MCETTCHIKYPCVQDLTLQVSPDVPTMWVASNSESLNVISLISLCQLTSLSICWKHRQQVSQVYDHMALTIEELHPVASVRTPPRVNKESIKCRQCYGLIHPDWFLSGTGPSSHTGASGAPHRAVPVRQCGMATMRKVFTIRIGLVSDDLH